MTTKVGCRQARIFSQFDGTATAGRNCGVSVSRSMVHFGSRGLIKPTSGEIRIRMKNLKEWTDPIECKRAVDSYDTEVKKHGLKPLRYVLAGKWTSDKKLILSGASKSSLINAVKANKLAHVVVDYGKFNDILPRYSGSKGFRGLHAAWVGGGTKKNPGWRKKNNRLEVRYGDSTYNRAGTPKGPQWIPFAKLWKCLDGAWSSRGGTGWVGGTIKCSPYLPVFSQPEPVDPNVARIEELETEIEDLEQKVQRKESALSEAKALIAELEGKRLPRRLVTEMRGLLGDIDDVLELVDDYSAVEPGMVVAEG